MTSCCLCTARVAVCVHTWQDTCGRDRSGGTEKARNGLKFLEVEKTLASDTITIPAAHANMLAAKRHPQLESKLGGALNDYPCGGQCQILVLWGVFKTQTVLIFA